MSNNYDIIILGAGIAGLYIANRIKQLGYNFLLIEKNAIGGTQTLASQGMIHGGQKYVLQGKLTGHGVSAAKMPERWEANFSGNGEIDLSAVKFLSDTQLMFPAGSILSNVTVFAAAKAVNGKTEKLEAKKIPSFIKSSPVYELQEKVLDTKSLVKILAKNIEGRVLQGDLQKISSDGKITASGVELEAKLIVSTAGKGNEDIFTMLGMDKEKYTQRRPLCQVMVSPMQETLYGHGVVESPKPRVTVTAHPIEGAEGFIWYLGGNVAEKSVNMSDEEALAFAKKEMADIFPDINWDEKEWSLWRGDRAEPLDAKGDLPLGPYIHSEGNVMLAWPAKLTFVPALADMITKYLDSEINKPSPCSGAPELPGAQIGEYVWENAKWQTV